MKLEEMQDMDLRLDSFKQQYIKVLEDKDHFE